MERAVERWVGCPQRADRLAFAATGCKRLHLLGGPGDDQQIPGQHDTAGLAVLEVFVRTLDAHDGNAEPLAHQGLGKRKVVRGRRGLDLGDRRTVVGLADWIDVALVITGIVLILVEIFVIPGFGVVGVLGIMFVIAGVVFSFTFTDFTLPQYSWEWDRLEDAGFSLTMTMLCMVALVAATWKFLPKTPLYGHLVLADQQLPSHGYTVQSSDEVSATVGQEGTASSMLRPAGRGRFGDKTVQVVSLSEFIEEGAPIVIVQAEGNRYVVDRIKKPA